MRKEELEKDVTHLEKAFEKLSSSGMDYEQIVSRYMEYQVASSWRKESMVFRFLLKGVENQQTYISQKRTSKSI